MIVLGFVANIQLHKSSRFLDNITSLSGHKVSIICAKMTSNIAMPSKWVKINFEFVHLIIEPVNSEEACTVHCETSKMELFCENSYWL